MYFSLFLCGIAIITRKKLKLSSSNFVDCLEAPVMPRSRLIRYCIFLLPSSYFYHIHLVKKSSFFCFTYNSLRYIYWIIIIISQYVYKKHLQRKKRERKKRQKGRVKTWCYSDGVSKLSFHLGSHPRDLTQGFLYWVGTGGWERLETLPYPLSHPPLQPTVPHP